jgi:branched-chain amino acid transport system permease protein
MIFMMMGWAIYLVYRVGQLCFMPVVSMLVGAYFVGYVTRDMGWPIPLAVIVAPFIGSLLALPAAMRLARMPGFSTAVITIGLLLVAQTIILNIGFLGKRVGFVHIPHMGGLLPISLIIVLVVGFFIYRLEHSRFGREMDMAFVAPEAAMSLGIDFAKLSVMLQVFAGGLGGIAGALYAFQTRSIAPSEFGFSLIVSLLAFLFVGGYSTMWGIVIGTPLLWALSVFLPEWVAVWRGVIYGCLLILVIVARPSGIIDRKLMRAFGDNIYALFARVRLSRTTITGSRK